MPTEVKHTPGPWKVTAHPPYNKVIASHGQGRQPVYFDVALCHLETDRAEANARLIAAAPDLLEACKAMLSAIKDSLASGVSINNHKYDAVGQQVLAAIKKAEGAQ